MKIIKVIDLLTMIAKHKKLPKKIQIRDRFYILFEDTQLYYELESGMRLGSYIPLEYYLNNPVLIVEELENKRK